MNQRLSFLLSPEIARLFNHFTGIFDVRIAYFTPDGTEMVVGLDRSWCGYCRLLRNVLGDNALCIEADRSGRDLARKGKKMVHYQCHGGMLEAVKPVFTGEELIGFIMIGQVRTTDSLPADKERRWADTAADNRLREGWSEVPYIPRNKMEHILALFSSLVDLIISKHMVSILGRHQLDPVIARMTEHPEEQLDLQAVARLIGKSTDRTSHLFDEACGKSFKSLQRELRMKLAAELLAGSKNLGIKEVASRCGYDDPLYFARVFRAHFGIPPSAFRKQTG